MAGNRGGQHQRRPRLSLMGLAASTILIRSLSLKPTDWPLYLHETGSCSMCRCAPANIWPCGPSHTAQVTLANKEPMQGPPTAKSVHCLHIHFTLSPAGCSSFFTFSVWIFFPPKSSLFVTIVYLALWPPLPTPHPTLLLTHVSYPGNEDGA